MLRNIFIGLTLALVLHCSFSRASFDLEKKNEDSINLTGPNDDQSLLLIEGNCENVNETDIVLQQTVDIWGFPLFTQNKEIKWNGDKNISCITVFCVQRIDHPGTVSIHDGGIGHYYIDLKLKSDWSYGIHMMVYVYGK